MVWLWSLSVLRSATSSLSSLCGLWWEAVQSQQEASQSKTLWECKAQWQRAKALKLETAETTELHIYIQTPMWAEWIVVIVVLCFYKIVWLSVLSFVCFIIASGCFMFDSSAFYLFNAKMSLTWIYIITYSTVILEWTLFAIICNRGKTNKWSCLVNNSSKAWISLDCQYFPNSTSGEVCSCL